MTHEEFQTLCKRCHMGNEVQQRAAKDALAPYRVKSAVLTPCAYHGPNAERTPAHSRRGVG